MFVGTDFSAAPEINGGRGGYAENRLMDGSSWSVGGMAAGAVANPGLYGGASGQIMWDDGYRRPYLDKHGRLAVTVNTGRFTRVNGVKTPIREHRLVRDLVNNGQMAPPPVTNATALRKEEWNELDRTVVRAARKRLRFYADINKFSGSFGGFNAMGKLMLEYESMADPGEAVVDMNGLTPGRNDDTSFKLEGLPLALTHADFWLDSRRLAASRNTGTPIDGTLGEGSARRIGEMVEKTSIGNVTGVTFAGNITQTGGYNRTATVYGALNFGDRNTYTGTAPTNANWTPQTTLNDVLAGIDVLRLKGFFGPYMIYHSNDWDQYLDRDYFATNGTGTISGIATRTLRQRLTDIAMGDGTTDEEKTILGCRRLDFLFAAQLAASTGNIGMHYLDTTYPFTFFIIQMTPEVVRAINGLDVTTVQWEERGGMMLKFKVMAIQVPQFRSDYYANCGILHATCS
jgi:hypothetical protein